MVASDWSPATVRRCQRFRPRLYCQATFRRCGLAGQRVGHFGLRSRQLDFVAALGRASVTCAPPMLSASVASASASAVCSISGRSASRRSICRRPRYCRLPILQRFPARSHTLLACPDAGSPDGHGLGHRLVVIAGGVGRVDLGRSDRAGRPHLAGRLRHRHPRPASRPRPRRILPACPSSGNSVAISCCAAGVVGIGLVDRGSLGLVAPPTSSAMICSSSLTSSVPSALTSSGLSWATAA